MSAERLELLERCGRAYGELRLAVCWTVTNDPAAVDENGDKLAKTCRTGGWERTRPYASADFAAGEFPTRLQRRNPAVVSAASGLVNLDLDLGGRAKLAELIPAGLPATVEVLSTPALGKGHLWFRPPPGKPGGVFELGSGGVAYWSEKYLLVPPARHPDGHLYEFAPGRAPDEVEVAQLPLEAYETLWAEYQKDKGNKNGAGADDSAPIVHPHRYRALLALAGAMRRAGSGEAEILAALLVRNELRCSPPRSEGTVRELARDICQRYPAGEVPGGEGWREWMRKAAADDEDEPGAAGGPVRRFSEVQEKPLRWLAPDLIPIGAPTLVVGHGGLGKTITSIHVGARLTHGLPIFPGMPAMDPGNVLYISGEDAIAEILMPRARLAGADLSRFHGFDLTERDLSLPDDVSFLCAEAEKIAARLIVIDPISSFLGSGIDSHRDASLRGALRPLAALAEELGAAVIGVVHPNQSPGGDVARRVSGSGAWVNAARAALVFGRPPGVEPASLTRVLAVGKANYSPTALAFEVELHVPAGERHPILRYVGPSPVTAAQLLDQEGEDGRQAKARDAAEFLSVHLADGDWHDSKEVKAAGVRAGHSERTLQRALGAVEVRKEGFPPRTVWRLAPMAPTSGGAAVVPLFGAIGENGSEQAVSEEGSPMAPTVALRANFGAIGGGRHWLDDPEPPEPRWHGDPEDPA